MIMKAMRVAMMSKEGTRLGREKKRCADRIKLTVILAVASYTQAASLDRGKAEANGLAQRRSVDVGDTVLVAYATVRKVEALARHVTVGIRRVVGVKPMRSEPIEENRIKGAEPVQSRGQRYDKEEKRCFISQYCEEKVIKNCRVRRRLTRPVRRSALRGPPRSSSSLHAQWPRASQGHGPGPASYAQTGPPRQRHPPAARGSHTSTYNPAERGVHPHRLPHLQSTATQYPQSRSRTNTPTPRRAGTGSPPRAQTGCASGGRRARGAPCRRRRSSRAGGPERRRGCRGGLQRGTGAPGRVRGASGASRLGWRGPC